MGVSWLLVGPLHGLGDYMNQFYTSVLLSLSLLVFQGCSNQIASLGEGGDKIAGIIHGMEIPANNHPEVVKITVGSGLCTGVFVNANPPTVLTASHCLKSLPTKDSNDGGVKFGTAKSRRACVPKGAIGHVNPFDMAVVVFDSGAFDVPGVAPVSHVDPKAGASVTLVGFGRNTGKDGALITGAGKKRLGLNLINRIVSGSPEELVEMIELKGAEEGDLPEQQIIKDHDSSPNHGDSGGPLYLNLPEGEVVVGLVSGGNVKNGVSTAYYTNLRSKDLKAFLSRALSPSFLDDLSETDTQSNYTDVCAVK